MEGGKFFNLLSGGITPDINQEMLFSHIEDTRLLIISRTNLVEDIYKNKELLPTTIEKHNRFTRTEARIVNQSQGRELTSCERMSYARKLKKKLNTDITLHGWPDEVPSDIARELGDVSRIAGYYDPKSDRVGIVLHNTPTKKDIARTMMHEVVGHRGIHGLFGHRAYTFYIDVFESMPEDKKSEYLARYASPSLAANEYIADLAGSMYKENVFRQLWSEVCVAFWSVLRAMGINIKLNDDDIRFVLREVYRQTRSGLLREIPLSESAVELKRE